jgi:Tfp pilus assembly protein PilV
MRGGKRQPIASLAPSRPRRRSTSQAGATLIEVMIAVFLIGTVIAAIAAGMLTLMRSTRTTSEQQRLAVSVLSYTEWLRSQAYTPCATPADFATWSPLPQVEGRVDSVKYWDVAAGAAWGSEPFGSSCTTDQGRQLLDVTVQLDGGRSTTAQVVLRGTP